MAAAKNPYWLRVLIALDVFAATLLLGGEDTTISAHCGLALRDGGAKPLKWIGKALNHFWPGHCSGAIASDYNEALQTAERLTTDAATQQALINLQNKGA